MPRRNLYLLLVVTVFSLLCYRKADSAHRSRYGRMFDTFVKILNTVEKDYVEQVDERQLFEGALDGMVARLDPYSDYLPPVEATRSREHLDQEFGGIGIEVSFDPQTNVLMVVSPMYGTPAFKAGILAGDKILRINDESTEGFTFEDAVKRLRGKVGQSVALEVLHSGEEDPVPVEVVREVIQVAAVLGDRRASDGQWSYLLPGEQKLGYVRVTSFGRRVAEELRAAIESLQTAGAQGLILDLRNNGGGLLDVAVDTCDLFIHGEPAKDVVVTVQGREQELSRHRLTGKAPFTTLPLVVLVNQNSASASEIVAACLQDYHRAAIVGQRTFGKGTVQEIKRLEGGKSELRLTIAKYLRPSRQNIHRDRNAKESDVWGVVPDDGCEVKLSTEEFRAVLRARRARDLGKAANGTLDESAKDWLEVDTQLQRGIEMLAQRIAAAK